MTLQRASSMKHSPHGKTKTYLDGVSGASEGSGGKNEDSREFHCFLGKVDQKMLERIVPAMQWLDGRDGQERRS